MLTNLVNAIQANLATYPKFNWTNGELRRHEKLVIGSDPTLKLQILSGFMAHQLGPFEEGYYCCLGLLPFSLEGNA